MKTTLIVSGFIHKNNKVLLGLRPSNKKHFPNHWEMPGGKIDEGEQPQEALSREINEETNIKIKQYVLYDSKISYINEQERCLINYYIINEFTGELIPEEFQELKWVEEKDLSNYRITEQQLNAIKKGFELVKK